MTAWRTRLQFSLIEAFVLVVLLSLVWLRWRCVKRSSARQLDQKQTSFARSLKDKHVADDPDSRGHRAMALMCAAICWRGDPTDQEGMLGVADEFLQYIEGNNAMMPRPDQAIKGRLPNGGKR
jgi:hypothetical protein